MIGWVQIGAHILALGAMAGAVVIAIGAARARSLVAMCVYVAASAIFAAIALMALNAGEAALGLTLVGVGAAPVVVLAVLLLSTRAAKPRAPRAPWFAIAGAAASVLAFGWAAFASAQAASPPARIEEPMAIGAWLALLVFAAIMASLGLLGFGERGAFEHRGRRGA